MASYSYLLALVTRYIIYYMWQAAAKSVYLLRKLKEPKPKLLHLYIARLFHLVLSIYWGLLLSLTVLLTVLP